MSGGGTTTTDASAGESIVALLVVVLFAQLGGFLIQLLGGINTKKFLCIPACKLDPVLKSVTIPPLVGMILMGGVARNALPDLMEDYNDEWANYIRQVCLSVILLRGGLELDFEGKGLIVLLLTLLPQSFEASAVAFTSLGLIGMPLSLCFALGFIIGAVSPAVLVPSCMILQEKGYGVAKGIPTSLMAASSFDDIIAITVFSICSSLAFSQLGTSGEDPMEAVVLAVLQIVAGLAFGIFLGICFGYLKRLSNNKKGILCLLVAFGITVGAELVHFYESKYIAVIFFGYFCHRSWEENKPDSQLAFAWEFFKPFLFGTVGAAVKLKEIDSGTIGQAILIILIGISFRWVGTYLAGCGGKFTRKERMFMAFAWIPKATVQAAIGGLVLNKAREKPEFAEYEPYGVKILTTAVLSIIFTAPLGAILTNSLGPRWLERLPSKDGMLGLSMQLKKTEKAKNRAGFNDGKLQYSYIYRR
jgi:NhaP-type Na+/H+ or K+/H+ antiporter